MRLNPSTGVSIDDVLISFTDVFPDQLESTSVVNVPFNNHVTKEKIRETRTKETVGSPFEHTYNHK